MKMKQSRIIASVLGGNRTSFTLIELLVVIAIIAILAGMLLPALNSAKKTAQGVICKSRMKSIVYANTLYQGDYKEWAPFRNPDIGSGTSGHFEFHCYVSPYLGNYLDKFKGNWEQKKIHEFEYSKPFLCPVEAKENAVAVYPLYKDSKVPLVTNFAVYYLLPDKRFPQMSNAVMLADIKGESNPFFFTFYTFDKVLSWIAPRHGKSANTGFFDGSVRSERYFEEKFISFDLSKTGKGFISNIPPSL